MEEKQYMKVNAQVANFNVVFGDDEKPMLDYFDSVVYPAFKSDIMKNGKDGSYYFLHEIELMANKKGDMTIIGKIIKKTTLEIFSDLNDDGDLIEKEEHYSSAPYSTFVIYLRNHRMLFVPNQKGSPTLLNFKSTVAYILKQYISNYNLENEKKLPYAIVNVVGIPSAKSMEELLKSAKKINSLTLKFYPLNGDLDFSQMFGMMANDLRRAVGSKTGQTVLNSPKSVDGIIDVLQQANGTIDPILKVTTSENSVVRLHDYHMTEKYGMDFDGQLTSEQKKEKIVNKADEIEMMQFTNDNHNQIYERNESKLKSFITKK